MGLVSRIEALELAVLALGRAEFGDHPGHEFRGNQWTEAYGGEMKKIKADEGAEETFLLREKGTQAPIGVIQREKGMAGFYGIEPKTGHAAISSTAKGVAQGLMENHLADHTSTIPSRMRDRLTGFLSKKDPDDNYDLNYANEP